MIVKPSIGIFKTIYLAHSCDAKSRPNRKRKLKEGRKKGNSTIFQPAGVSALEDIMLCPCMGLSGVEGAEIMLDPGLLDPAVGVAGPESSSSPPPSSKFLCE